MKNRLFVCFATVAVFSVVMVATADPQEPRRRLFGRQNYIVAQEPAPAAPPAKGINNATGKPFPRGAFPTPRHILSSAARFKPYAAAPASYAVVPSKLSMWLNDTYGDCVTAEEAFTKACSGIFISDNTVLAWARGNGVLDGANLQPVIQQMQKSGFSQDGNHYNDGQDSVVDYSNESILKAAISSGPVKLGIDANALPNGAGNVQGWTAFGGRPGQFNNEDHCTALCGYGTAAQCFAALHLPVPSGVDPAKADCYLHFTWSTVGVVDHAWIMSTCGEAWLRTPNTVIVGTGTPAPDPPLDPTPTPTPPTPTPPTPTPPDPTGDIVVTIPAGTAPGSYTIGSGKAVARIDLFDADGNLIQSLNTGGLDNIDRPPPGWLTDKEVAGQIAKAATQQGKGAEYGQIASDRQAHAFLMRVVHNKMQRDAEGRALLKQYKAGALPPGWLQNFLDWLIKNGPALINFIMTILKLFGL